MCSVIQKASWNEMGSSWTLTEMGFVHVCLDKTESTMKQKAFEMYAEHAVVMNFSVMSRWNLT